MEKNVVVACGLGDLFTFLTRLDDFFEKNSEYTSIKFWTWLHHPKLAKELVSLDKHNVSVYSLEDMNEYILDVIPKTEHEKASEHFVRQNPTGVGVDKYLEYMGKFFPNLEQWIYLPVYEKYNSTFPYKLEKASPSQRERPYIVVHPFSTTVKTEKPERTWSTKRWGNLLRMMRRYYNDVDLVIIGTKKDKIEGPRDFPKEIIDMRNKTTLTEAISLIYGASAVVGTNSWSSFISLWAGIPTYSQWFVQQQLIPSHHPKAKLDHLFIESSPEHPTVETVWNNVRTLIDARTTL